MTGFLWYIGWYNTVGPLILIAFLNPKFAETMLVKVVQVAIAPYSHGTHGGVWIWWALTSNIGLGAVMVQAASWPVEMQRGVTAAVIGVYAVMLLVVVAAAIRPADRWRRYGIWSTIGLWVAQIGWGSYGLATA